MDADGLGEDDNLIGDAGNDILIENAGSDALMGADVADLGLEDFALYLRCTKPPLQGALSYPDAGADLF